MIADYSSSRRSAMTLLLVFVFALFASSALAQSGTVLDLGGGLSIYNDSSGQSGTIIELGGIKTYHDSHGTAGNNLDHGAGLQGFPFATPTQPFAPAFQAIPQMERAQMGFDEKYERDYNIFNPINQYRPDNPLNPINSTNPTNPFNLINGVDPGNPANPINRMKPNNPFNPINQINPYNPLNPINRYNLDMPFKPLNR
jgi:hypothetical protein